MMPSQNEGIVVYGSERKNRRFKKWFNDYADYYSAARNGVKMGAQIVAEQGSRI